MCKKMRHYQFVSQPHYLVLACWWHSCVQLCPIFSMTCEQCWNNGAHLEHSILLERFMKLVYCSILTFTSLTYLSFVARISVNSSECISDRNCSRSCSGFEIEMPLRSSRRRDNSSFRSTALAAYSCYDSENMGDKGNIYHYIKGCSRKSGKRQTRQRHSSNAYRFWRRTSHNCWGKCGFRVKRWQWLTRLYTVYHGTTCRWGKSDWDNR